MSANRWTPENRDDLLHKVSEQVYQRAAQTQATGESQSTDETVEDAEFEVIDDEPTEKS